MKARENPYVTGYKNKYRKQVAKLQEFTSFFVEFLDKADLSPTLTKHILHEFGSLRERLLSNGRDNYLSYSAAANHIEDLRGIIKLLKEKNP